jgi:modification methylase
MKRMNEDKQMRSDWELALCTGAERTAVNGEKLHTTQKPEALLYRVLLSSSNPGDIVLDPFFGTGTTGAVAKKLGRHYIGIEKEHAYIDAARRRIESIPARSLDDEVFGRFETRRSAPRIAFSALLEHGFLHPGATLFFDRVRERMATVLADGSLRLPDGRKGSIHQIGAAVANLPACNGWEHWYYENDREELVVIDQLRETIRKSLKPSE